MKKVLVGIGIGCGAMVFIGAIALAAGGVWFRGKTRRLVHDTEQVQSLEQRISELNQRYAFIEPPPGQPFQLPEKRLQDYLLIRLALKPVLADFQVRARQFEPPKGEPPKQRSLSQSFQALGMITELRGQVSSKWLDELERQQMSPREFRTISAAVYGPQPSKVNVVLLERYRSKIEDVASPGLDALLVSGDAELGASLQEALGGDGGSPGAVPSK